MNIKFSPVAVTVCLLLGAGLPFASFAAATATPSPAQMQATMQQMNQEMIALQKQTQALQQQLNQMKKQQQGHMAPAPAEVPAPHTNETTANTQLISASTANTPGRAAPAGLSSTNVGVPTSNLQDYYSQLALKALKQSGYMGGSPVTTSPYLGVRSQYNGSDLIVNISSVNTDIALLQQQQQFENAANKLGIPLPTHPRLNVSGQIQPQASYTTNYGGGNSSNIILNDAELDLVPILNRWVMGYMDFAYNPNPNYNTPLNVLNSPLTIDRAFLTLGNLNSFPVYTTFGQSYVPFGQYNTYMINNPYTKDLGRTKALTAILGFHPKSATGFMAQLYGYRGYTTLGNPVTNPSSGGPSNINQFGANVDYSFSYSDWSSDSAVSYISNLADSVVMQTGGVNSPGFALNQPVPIGAATTTQVNETLSHNIPALDAREQIGYKAFTLIGEYVGALTPFSATNMTFNGNGAKPQALDVEGVYTFDLLSKPSSFAIGYNHTWQALALAFPENSYAATLNVSILRDILASVQFEHDQNYSSGDTSSVDFGAGGFSAATPPGHSQNQIVGQLTAFF